MRVNVKKTKVMKVSDDPTPVSVAIRGEKVEEVHTFKYVGAVFKSHALCDDEIKARLLQGRQRMGQLTRYLEKPYTNQQVKSQADPSVSMAHCHIRRRGVDVKTRTTRKHRGF